MKNKTRIEEYAKNSLKKGHSSREVRQSLISAGWEEKDVNEVLILISVSKAKEKLSYIQPPANTAGSAKLEAYIIDMLSRGVSSQKIRDRVLSVGWKEQDFMESYHKITGK
ncbi:MAG: hypothetical protein EPN86_04875 [Nanoarchaeota archaeon]|nr:MAG: hypothetical protein EPN86_04875 [Nanoarchaeota archaeon]